MNEIKIKQLEKLNEEYANDPKHVIVRHALSNHTVDEIAGNQDNANEMDFNFSININTLPVTNQKMSGRCWLFAATNLLRERIAKVCNMTNFEISQSYLAFYDKLEKFNYTLEALIELINKDYDDRTVQYLVNNGVGDGGQWDMFVSIVNKYGVCPKNAYPETATSSCTRQINSLINAEVCKFASESRAVYAKKGSTEAVNKLKNTYVERVYLALVDCYGVPPTSFDFEYTDKDGKYHNTKNISPKEFTDKYVGDYLNNFVSLINAPTKSKPFGKTYTIKYLGNVVGGKTVTHLNVEMKRMKELIIAQLKDDSIVWFGSDVAYYGDRAKGVWDDAKFDYKSLVNLDYKMDKGEALDFRCSAMNHAMCITGVNLARGVPTKWKIENSWGEDRGNKGYYEMSASWFDRYTYQAVIDKKYLNDKELDALKKNPVELKPWDPMGSLAD